MKKILLIALPLTFILGSIQSTEAQLLKKMKKKAEKKIENTMDGKQNSQKTNPQRKETSTTKSTSSNKTSGATSTKKSGTSTPGEGTPSWVDTSRSRNAFWKEDIAQELLDLTGPEPYKNGSAWNKAKTFTEEYNSTKETIEKGERPDIALDLVDFIDAMLDPEEFDTRLANFNDKMGGPFSSTNFWKKTEKTLLEWKKVALDWKDSPATHFNKEGIPFETNVNYLNSVTIDTVSNEDAFELKFDVKGLEEPKSVRFTTVMELDEKEYENADAKIYALDNGYFSFEWDKTYRVVFGPDAEEAKKVEASLDPLFPENSMDDCVVCKEGTGKILITTQGEPIKPRGMDFYENDAPWNGIDPIYARFVLPASPENIVSRTNPWGGQKEFKLRFYLKGDKQNAQMGWQHNDFASGNNPTFWYRMYDGIDQQKLPPRTFEYLHYVLMRKGPGKYTVVAELFLKEGDDINGWTETTIATGEKAVSLSEADYKKLFVGPKQGIGAFRPPVYTAAASGSVKAAVQKMYPNVKATYMSVDNEWKWVLHPITGIKMYQINHGVVAILDLNEAKRKGAFYIKLTAKRNGSAYSIVGEEEFIETSRQNFNIK